MLLYYKPDAVAESNARKQLPTDTGLVSASPEPSVKVVPLWRSASFVSHRIGSSCELAHHKHWTIGLRRVLPGRDNWGEECCVQY